ncbi:Atu4866 domain-containing protein [Aeromicrobium sp. CTD01-1L150]|uniref:Atu4866 domain-containing protein n=1 Tax=Aeromicrobium sp. CTD01-1L150 TaxID=3341830 RepID=UPI0035C0B3E9
MNEERTRTFVISGAMVMRTPGDETVRDLFVSDGRIVAQPADTEPHMISAAGAYVVPLMVDSAVAARPASKRAEYDLSPVNDATFAVVRRPVTETQVRTMLILSPRDVMAVYVSGQLEVCDGEATRRAGADVAEAATSATWVGTWEDPARGLEQHLLPDGRYSETRGGRADAYTGRYWVHEDRITYRDDSGFWAFGELQDSVLHHAGFMMTRR